jgi:hypothetical protein
MTEQIAETAAAKKTTYVRLIPVSLPKEVAETFDTLEGHQKKEIGEKFAYSVIEEIGEIKAEIEELQRVQAEILSQIPAALLEKAKGAGLGINLVATK